MSSAVQEDGKRELRLFGAFNVRLNGQPLPSLRYRKGAVLRALRD